MGGTATNDYGEVYGSQRKKGDAADVQIFIFKISENNRYYAVSKSGEYITYGGIGMGWNVNGDTNDVNAQDLYIESTGKPNEYTIKAYNVAQKALKYFCWNYVEESGKYHAFNNADIGDVFIFELANLPEYDIIYKYIYNGNIVKCVEHTVVKRDVYPDYDLGIYSASYDDAPTGTVTADGLLRLQ